MKRGLVTIATLVGAQALILGIWYAVERGHSPNAELEAMAMVAQQRTTEMDRPSPNLELRRLDGSTLRLAETRGRPLVLHFWATWCLPCRDELPALLAYAAEGDMPVLAVSLDPDWGIVRRFLGSNPPPPVVLANGDDIKDAFGVRSLPVTFVVSAEGQLRLQLDGPRDWASPAIRDSVRDPGPASGGTRGSISADPGRAPAKSSR
jgi:thiol-disulfide isomerase/thioredoxin